MNRRQLLMAAPALLTGAAGRVASAPARWVLEPTPVLTGLHSPVGMAYDSAGTLYIANWGSGSVERVRANGQRDLLARDLSGPSGLAVAPDGSVLVASYSDDLVWRITPQGVRSVFLSHLATPAGLSFEPNGRLLIANRRSNQILACEPDGKLVPVATDLATPVGAVRLENGALVVANIDGGISVVDETGKARTLSGALHRPGPGMVRASNSAVLVVDYGGTGIWQVSLSGQAEMVVDKLASPVGLTRSPQGDLMVATWGDNALFRARPASP